MPNSANPETNAQAREGYRAAVQMITYEGQLIWRVFNSMLAANAFIVAVGGATINGVPQLVILAKIIFAVGIGICLAWYLITTRQFDYYKYWFAWARELEGLGLHPVCKMISEGKRFSEGESVRVGGGSERMHWSSRLWPVRWLINTVILVFGSMYLALLYVVV